MHREVGMWRLGWCCHKPRNLPEAKERLGTDPPLEASEGAQPCHSLLSDFWFPELCNEKFRLLQDTQFVVLCYRGTRKPKDQVRVMKVQVEQQWKQRMARSTQNPGAHCGSWRWEELGWLADFWSDDRVFGDAIHWKREKPPRMKALTVLLSAGSWCLELWQVSTYNRYLLDEYEN